VPFFSDALVYGDDVVNDDGVSGVYWCALIVVQGKTARASAYYVGGLIAVTNQVRWLLVSVSNLGKDMRSDHSMGA
jgi:hypothetical protein